MITYLDHPAFLHTVHAMLAAVLHVRTINRVTNLMTPRLCLQRSHVTTGEKMMAELSQSIVFVHLFCLLFLDGAHPAPACSPSEPPIVLQPVFGALEDAMRRLDPLHNCTVQLYLLSGVHVISSGVSVSAASVALSSHPNNTGRPVVRCGDNMSHPGDSVNETGEVGFLTFWKGARDVSISGVDFEGCPRTVQFIEVDRVSISDCTFRSVIMNYATLYTNAC